MSILKSCAKNYFFCTFLRCVCTRFPSLPVLTKNSMSNEIHVSELRKKYKESHEYFDESVASGISPITLFENWFNQARNEPAIKEPNAMCLATVNSEGRPTARMVLLKDFGHDGFTFFTNYRSAKAKDLDGTPFAALVLYWTELCRSVRIEGLVEKLSASESAAYFSKRPKENQIAAHVSNYQSEPIEGRQVLEKRAKALDEEYKEKEVPCPKYWGGYVVKPDKFEFYQGQSSRMSDRIVFAKTHDESQKLWKSGDDGWSYQRLQP